MEAHAIGAKSASIFLYLIMKFGEKVGDIITNENMHIGWLKSVKTR